MMNDILPLKIMDLGNGLKAKLKIGSEDFIVYHEIFAYRVYENLGTKILPSDVVLDAGAHIGMFTLYAAPKCKQVISFEPSPSTFNRLKENIEFNKLKNVVAFNEAIGSRKGEIFLYESKHKACNTIQKSFTNEKEFKSRLVPMSFINDILKEYKCSYLKFDIEGAEYETIQHLDFNKNPQVKTIVGEIHRIDEKYNIDWMVSFLSSKGFASTIFYNAKHAMIYSIKKEKVK